jgi:hypothetical protein
MSRYPQILKAIEAVRAQVRWKPGSAMRHLRKRKLQGHLPPTAILEDYERIISDVLRDKSAQVYLYWYERMPYVTVVATVQAQQWLGFVKKQFPAPATSKSQPEPVEG